MNMRNQIRARRAAIVLCACMCLGFGAASDAGAQESETEGVFVLPKTLPAPARTQSEGEGKSLSPTASAWVSGLARAGIIAVGSYPISLLYTNVGFDLGAYLIHGGDSRYAPWPFRNTNSIDPGTEEKTLRLMVAAGVSLCVGLLDMLLVSLPVSR